MIKMNLTKSITGGIILSAVAFVGFYLYRQSLLLKSLCYEVSGIRYAGGGQGKTNLITTIKFNNYSDVLIKLTKYRIDAFLNNQLIGKIESDDTYEIPAKGSANIEFVSTSDTTDAVSQVINTLVTQLIDQQSSIFSLKGMASIKMGIVSVDNYPIEITYDTKELLDLTKTEGEGCPEIT